jgi:phosphate transport system substrate-binding protein
MAKVGNGNGEMVALTAEAAGKTINGAQVTGTGDDLKLKIDYATKEAGAYPIVLVSYEIVCSRGNDSGKLALLKSFLKFAVSAGEQAALAGVGYGPLPDSIRTKVDAAVANLA